MKSKAGFVCATSLVSIYYIDTNHSVNVATRYGWRAFLCHYISSNSRVLCSLSSPAELMRLQQVSSTVILVTPADHGTVCHSPTENQESVQRWKKHSPPLT